MKNDRETVTARIIYIIELLDEEMLCEIERLIRGYINAKSNARKEARIFREIK